MNQNLANFLLCGCRMEYGNLVDRISFTLIRPVDPDGQKFSSHVSGLRLRCHYRAFIFPDIFALFCVPGNPLYDRLLSD